MRCCRQWVATHGNGLGLLLRFGAEPTGPYVCGVEATGR